jgi:hypothetical protein
MSDDHSAPTSDPAGSRPETPPLVIQAARDAATDARAAASRTWEATGRFLNRFLYTTCYTVSYGVVFSSVLLARAIPRENPAVRGMIDGATAARRKVDVLCDPALTRPLGPSVSALPAT